MPEDDVKELRVDAQAAVLRAIINSAGKRPVAVLQYAEAYAWLNSTSQPHGGSVSVKG